ncbi:MAG: anti-sigma factor family protein [Sphingobium phenoxybenzoativorans]
MSAVSEDMLVAYADGELDEVNRRRVERAIADDDALAERLAAHVALRERLSGHFAPVAQEAVPDRFRALLEPQGAADNVVSLSDVREKGSGRLWTSWGMGAAIAASLVLGLGLGRSMNGEAGPVGVSGGKMVAQGSLAKALDTQLASAQGGSDVRIGLSFRAKDGGWCRSFEGAAVAGVACRDGGGWRLEQAVPGSGAAGDYRQASSGDARVSATVEALIAGDPADAAGEKAARDAGWSNLN